MKWEYKIEEWKRGSCDFIEWLNQHGDDKWELVQAFDWENTIVCWFKRAIP